jgi:hypothetical protein
MLTPTGECLASIPWQKYNFHFFLTGLVAFSKNREEGHFGDGGGQIVVKKIFKCPSGSQIEMQYCVI